MPLVRNVFIIGALALAGIPILNGFWSKELILEAGLSGGPVWLFGVMVLTAGLTAYYTFRCVWLVFFGQSRSHLHAHEAGSAMQVALVPLAIGSLLSWLAVGSFGKMLQDSLPFHHLETLPTAELLREIVTAPATLIALVVIVFGGAAWIARKNLTWIDRSMRSVRQAAVDSFGFEKLNLGIVQITQSGAEQLRDTQSGILSWNVAGILIGLLVVLIVLLWGA
jgi:NADH-quinone oxidoreductase subunit L